MEDPRQEICALVSRLISSPTPAVLRREVEAYFLPTAGFRHPLCLVERGPRSRESLLAIYDWYRSLSPHTHGRSRVLAYDEDSNLIVLETVQHFHLHFSPFKVAPARLVTNVVLEQDPDSGLHYIAYQEDFYHPDHFWNLLFPLLARIIRFFLWLNVLGCFWLAPLGHAFGLFTDARERDTFAVTTSRSPADATAHDTGVSVEVTLDLNPLHLLGTLARAFDTLVRARGVRYNPRDVVEATPGEEEMILYGVRPHSGG